MSTYAEALEAARIVGTGKADDAGAMAQFCEANIQLLCGAVSPRLVWEGAQRKGLTFLELGRLAAKDPAGVADLMWA